MLSMKKKNNNNNKKRSRRCRNDDDDNNDVKGKKNQELQGQEQRKICLSLSFRSSFNISSLLITHSVSPSLIPLTLPLPPFLLLSFPPPSPFPFGWSLMHTKSIHPFVCVFKNYPQHFFCHNYFFLHHCLLFSNLPLLLLLLLPFAFFIFFSFFLSSFPYYLLSFLLPFLLSFTFYHFIQSFIHSHLSSSLTIILPPYLTTYLATILPSFLLSFLPSFFPSFLPLPKQYNTVRLSPIITFLIIVTQHK